MTSLPGIQPHSGFIETGDARIHYLDWRNDEPPILIVHGNTHAGGVYSPLAERLSTDFRVIAMDLRGHGRSSKTDHYRWEAMRDDVTALIDHLALKNLVVVAHSRGGGVAILAACARQERVHGLVVFEPTVPLRLVDTCVSAEGEAAWTRDRLARSEGRRASFPSREAAYLHYKGRGAFKGWHDEYLRAFIEHCLVDNGAGGCELASRPEVESELVMARPDMQGWEGIGTCHVPVLALYGADSGRIGNRSNDSREAIRTIFPDTRIEVMENSTHSAPMEQPAHFESLIRTFVSQLQKS
ncbi:MAG: alpha/beta hydrolase [Pseudomonadota bacterium]